MGQALENREKKRLEFEHVPLNYGSTNCLEICGIFAVLNEFFEFNFRTDLFVLGFIVFLHENRQKKITEHRKNRLKFDHVPLKYGSANFQSFSNFFSNSPTFFWRFL